MIAHILLGWFLLALVAGPLIGCYLRGLRQRSTWRGGAR